MSNVAVFIIAIIVMPRVLVTKRYTHCMMHSQEPVLNSSLLDHAVVVVGYSFNVPGIQNHWLIRNSWGIAWGDRGYVALPLAMR